MASRKLRKEANRQRRREVEGLKARAEADGFRIMLAFPGQEGMWFRFPTPEEEAARIAKDSSEVENDGLERP